MGNEMSISTPSCNWLPSQYQDACTCYVDACSSDAQSCFSDIRGCGKEVAACAVQCTEVTGPFLDDIECMKSCTKSTAAGDLLKCAIQNEEKCESDSDQVLVLAPSCDLAPKPVQGACNCLVGACS